MAKRNTVRVVPNKNKGWKVKLGNKTVSQHRKKDTAVTSGRQKAKRNPPSQLVIHKQNGKIQTEYTYEDDPHPPDG